MAAIISYDCGASREKIQSFVLHLTLRIQRRRQGFRVEGQQEVKKGQQCPHVNLTLSERVKWQHRLRR